MAQKTEGYLYSTDDLREKQSWTFERKVNVSQSRILEFCMMNDNEVCVAFSGGADSTVLLDMVCKVWAVLLQNPCPLTVLYANTSNEFAAMPKHARRVVDLMREKYQIDIDYRVVTGKQSFYEIVKTKGYPVGSKKIAEMVSRTRRILKDLDISYNDISAHLDDGIDSAEYLRGLGIPNTIVCYLTGITSKNHKTSDWRIPKKWRNLLAAPFETINDCCDILKKEPMKLIQKETGKGVFIGTMASDSRTRNDAYRKSGCIIFNDSVKQCMPMGFWLEQDKLTYLKKYELPLVKVYGEIATGDDGTMRFTKEQHTGCKLCLFGCHLEKGEKNRIQRLAELEPAAYKFAMKPISEGGLGYKDVMEYIGIEYKVEE